MAEKDGYGATSSRQWIKPKRITGLITHRVDHTPQLDLLGARYRKDNLFSRVLRPPSPVAIRGNRLFLPVTDYSTGEYWQIKVH